MGCISSKPAEAEKEALQRNARIERTLKLDKKNLDRTIKILLLGALSLTVATSSRGILRLTVS